MKPENNDCLFISFLEQMQNNFEFFKNDVLGDVISTGYFDLDAALGGLPKGKITLIHGHYLKTTFLLNLINKISSHDNNLAYFSSHHSPKDITQSLLSLNSDIPLVRLNTSRISQKEISYLVDSFDCLSSKNLYLFYPQGKNFTPELIQSNCQLLKNNQGIKIDLIAIDSLNHMKVPGQNQLNRYEEYMWALQDIARQQDSVVLLTSNTSQNVLKRNNKRPLITDVLYSNVVNHFCANIIGIYADYFYNFDSPDKNIIEVLIQKNKNQIYGTIKLVFEPNNYLLKNFNK